MIKEAKKGKKPAKGGASRNSGAGAGTGTGQQRSISRKAFAWLPQKDLSAGGSPLIEQLEDEAWHGTLGKLTESIGINHTTNMSAMASDDALSASLEERVKEDTSKYEKMKSKKKSSDDKWIADIVQSGTISDRVAALTLMVQESPIHNIPALDNLVAMAAKKEQRTAILAIDAAKDLFISTLLPDRQLKALKSRPMKDPKMTLQVAMYMWYEDKLISKYEKFVQALEIGLKSTVEYFKKHCMDVITDLLIAKPEQEGRLLANIVNKMGDPSKAIDSKCIQLLKKVIAKHPAMKSVIIREVRQFMHRQGLSMRAMYTSVLFMHQIPLTGSKSDAAVAASLVETYVSLFEKAVLKDELGSRLLAALLNGINRAFPFLTDANLLGNNIDSLFRIVHTASFATSTQALVLISHIALGDAEVNMANRNSKKDKKNLRRDELAEEADGGEGTDAEDAPAGKASSEKEADESALVSLVNRFYRALYAQLFAEQMATRTRNTVFLNLLFRSLKRDPSELRVSAFIKRLCMMAVHSTAPIAAGILMLLSEVVKLRPKLGAILISLKDSLQHDDSVDLTDSSNNSDGKRAAQSNQECMLGPFDCMKREPLYAATSPPNLWEASLMKSHYHPSVQAFATSFAQTPHAIAFGGDPTTEFSITAFLNRFAYKNPKQNKNSKVSRAVASQEAPVNETFTAKYIKEVAPDKQFFYKFFGDRERLRSEGKSRDRKKKGQDEDSDADDGEEDEDEEAEIDAFADKLADDLMRSAAGDGGPDIDDDSFEGSYVSDDDDFEYGDAENDDDVDFDGDAGGDESADDADEEDGGDGYQLMIGGDDDDDDDDAMAAKSSVKSDAKQSRNVRKKSVKSSGESDFADADAYLAEMDKLVAAYSLEKNGAMETDGATEEESSSTSAKKRKMGSKRDDAGSKDKIVKSNKRKKLR